MLVKDSTTFYHNILVIFFTIYKRVKLLFCYDSEQNYIQNRVTIFKNLYKSQIFSIQMTIQISVSMWQTYIMLKEAVNYLCCSISIADSHHFGTITTTKFGTNILDRKARKPLHVHK